MTSTNPEEQSYAIDIIKKGICFVAYEKMGRCKFAPSHFAGYKNNAISKYEHSYGKDDGRGTNRVISNLIGHKVTENNFLEEEYK